MKNIPEEILIKALKLQEEGVSLERILADFPKEAEELKEYFRLASGLRAEMSRIEPPSRELLRGALRRAEAAAASGVSKSKGSLWRLPAGFRLLVPVLAVLVIVALSNMPQVSAPTLVSQNNEQPALTMPAPAPAADAPETRLPSVDNSAAVPPPAPAPALKAAALPPAAQSPAAANTMMMSAQSGNVSPSENADRYVEVYTANSENELALFSDTRPEEQAVRSEGSSNLGERWNGQDADKASGREAAERLASATLASLERSEANSTEAYRQSLSRLTSDLGSADADRRLALDAAVRNFRSDVLSLAQGGSARLEDFSRVAAQFQADLRSVTADFEAKAGDARAAFRASTGV